MAIRVWTGPCWVDQLESRFSRLVSLLGGSVLAGTEHLIFTGLTREEIVSCFKVAGLRGWTRGRGLLFR